MSRYFYSAERVPLLHTWSQSPHVWPIPTQMSNYLSFLPVSRTLPATMPVYLLLPPTVWSSLHATSLLTSVSIAPSTPLFLPTACPSSRSRILPKRLSKTENLHLAFSRILGLCGEFLQLPKSNRESTLNQQQWHSPACVHTYHSWWQSTYSLTPTWWSSWIIRRWRTNCEWIHCNQWSQQRPT